MIVAAGLLVLGGLGLFVAGVFTDVTALYWACVAACVVAAVLLYLARRQLRAQGTTAPATSGTAPVSTAPATSGAAPVSTAPATSEAAPVTTAPATAGAAPAGVRSGRHADRGDAPTDPPAAAAARGDAAVPEPAGATDADGPALPADPGGTGEPDGVPAERPAAEAPTATTPAAGATAVSVPAGIAGTTTGRTGTTAGTTTGTTAGTTAEPPVEEVEVTDLLLVVDLRDEVLVVDEHPRYHVPGCRHLAGQETIPLPVDEAKTDGFTPCGSCRPDATLADRVRARRHSGG
ncbi:hypothetical protein [Blastococcus sp. SYSU DS0617]